MPFSIKLTLPLTQEAATSIPDEEVDQLDDDDSDRPLFLVQACRAFANAGVQFTLAGCFAAPLPVQVETDFVYVLEDLPSLITFLANQPLREHSLGLWGQGIETEYRFQKADSGEAIQITATSAVERPVASPVEVTSEGELASQVVEVVRAYKIGIERFLPDAVGEPWNQRLFAECETLVQAGRL